MIRAKLLKNDGINASIQFSVKDTGIGLSKQQIKKLFQPFTQADTSTTRKCGGTGLGLSISQKLVSLMGGEIWVESEVGLGSTFFFSINFAVDDSQIISRIEDSREKLGIRVLVVDDKESGRELIGSMLAEMSLDVTMSTSGEEAISILKKTKEESKFDLIIMNWKMPGIDGIEASKLIKRMFPAGKAPAIILLTAHISEWAQENAQQRGILEAVLYKPVNASLLFNAIIHVCGKEGFQHIDVVALKENNSANLPKFNGTRVLLVEDNEINRELAQEILEEAGLNVTTAVNGLEAVEKVRANTFDIVLMDIQMPIMDGYYATREIRKDPAFADLPIIAMTANALSSDQKKCIQAGMNDHITKPIDTMLMFQTIKHWTSKANGENTDLFVEEEVKEIIKEYPGIDVQEGLGRLGGNQKLYSKLLKKFYINYKSAISEIRHMLDHADFKAAEMLVHTIKGAAGNLSAQNVYLIASDIENEFKVHRLDGLALLLEQFEHALEELFTSIIQMVGYLSILKPVLEKLEVLLNENSIDAVDCVEDITLLAENTIYSGKIAKMKDFVDQYDFEGASSILFEILNSIRKESDDEEG